MLSELKPRSRLHGRKIFLSASVPVPERRDEYERIEEAPIRIEEAVLCIARAVFVEGGTLVFGAHPSISPLVAQVVDDYYVPAPGERIEKTEAEESTWRNPSVFIYQSLVWQPYWAEITEQLSRRPLVQVKWVAAEPGERINLEVKDRSQAPKSMTRMREAMIEETSPVGMIAIGGMKGVLEEAEIFMRQRPGRPIFTLATTGGAAGVMASTPKYHEHVAVMDREAETLVREFWEQQSTSEPEFRNGKESRLREPAAKQKRKFYVPYAVVAQQIIARLIDDSENSPRTKLPSRAY